MTSAAALLAVQQTAGNRAVTALLGGQPSVVQRQLGTRSKDLFNGSGLQLQRERSSYRRIVKALRAVEKVKHPDLQQYESLEKLIREYVGDPAAEFGDSLYVGRKARLERLLNEVSDEKAPLLAERDHGRAQERYLENVINGGDGGGPDKHALGALTPYTKGELEEKNFGSGGPQALAGAKYGLTSAEIVAIQTFTSAGADYGYINPATQNDSKWLDKNKTSARTSPGFVRGASDKKTMDEGRLHAAVAISGMKKLPEYEGTLWRGLSFDQKEFQEKIVAGNSYRIGSLASASKASGSPIKYAQTSGKQYGVIFVMKNSGGRDINDISLVKNEKEVALLPSTFTIETVREIPLTMQGADATALYEVELGAGALSG